MYKGSFMFDLKLLNSRCSYDTLLVPLHRMPYIWEREFPSWRIGDFGERTS